MGVKLGMKWKRLMKKKEKKKKRTEPYTHRVEWRLGDLCLYANWSFGLRARFEAGRPQPHSHNRTEQQLNRGCRNRCIARNNNMLSSSVCVELLMMAP